MKKTIIENITKLSSKMPKTLNEALNFNDRQAYEDENIDMQHEETPELNGIEDNEWTKETHDLAGDNCENVKDATMYLSKLCKNETVHTPEAYMSYVKCDNPENVYKELIRWADLSKVNIQKDGRKVYVFAKRINKGTAIERFMNLSEPGTIDTIIAAGDNLMDVPMMNKANYAYARPDIYDIVTCHNKIKIEDEVFSDGICRSLEKMRMEGTF